MKLMTTAILVFSSVFIYGQYPQLEWAGSVGGNLYDRATSVALDSDGNAFIVGMFGGDILGGNPVPGLVDLDPSSGSNMLIQSGNEDAFIVKVDINGNLIWAHSLGGTGFDRAYSVEVAASGNVYVLGTVGSDSLDFDPGPAIELLPHLNGDTFILKLTNTGQFVWLRNFGFGAFNGQATVEDMTIDMYENIYTTGGFYDSVDFDPGVDTFLLATNEEFDYFVQKLDSMGNFVWVTSNSVDSVFARSANAIDVDQNGNVVIAGSVYTDPGILPLWPYCNAEIFVDKLDSQGNMIWNHVFYYGNCDDIVKDVNFDSSGDIYLTGYFTGTIDFDPGTGIANLDAASQAAYILKLSQFGDYQWANSYESGDVQSEAYGNALAIDFERNVYLSGVALGAVDFDETPDSTILVDKAFLLKLDSLGKYIWVIDSPYGNDIQVNNFGEIYLVGRANSFHDFDPNLGVYSLTSIQNGDAFIQKLSQCASRTDEVVTACNSFYWSLSDSTYTASTAAQFSLTNQNGCDSIITLMLEVDNLVADATVIQQGTELIASTVGANYQWVDCANGYIAIAGESNQSFMPSTNGTYAVIITTSSCTDTSNCLSSSLELNDFVGNHLQVYPNPTESFFDIVFESNELITGINIYSVSGQLVFQLNYISTNIQRVSPDLLEGVYTIEVSSNDQKYYKKIVKL